MRRAQYLIPLLLSTLLSYGCIQTPDPEYPERVNYTFFVSGVGDTLETDENQLYINEFKILADKLNIHVTDGSILESRPDGLIMKYTDTIEDDELVLGTEIGYEELNRFDRVDLFVAPPEEDQNIQDNEFFGGESNFSLIIKGQYNERNFTYRSGPSFEKNFDFSAVELSDSEPTLVLRVLLDVNEILKDQDGNLIDPGDEENQAVIDTLTKNNINLEAFSANNPFEQQ